MTTEEKKIKEINSYIDGFFIKLYFKFILSLIILTTSIYSMFLLMDDIVLCGMLVSIIGLFYLSYNIVRFYDDYQYLTTINGNKYRKCTYKGLKGLFYNDDKIYFNFFMKYCECKYNKYVDDDGVEKYKIDINYLYDNVLKWVEENKVKKLD